MTSVILEKNGKFSRITRFKKLTTWLSQFLNSHNNIEETEFKILKQNKQIKNHNYLSPSKKIKDDELYWEIERVKGWIETYGWIEAYEKLKNQVTIERYQEIIEHLSECRSTLVSFR